jgi:hypothetical protein
MSHRANVAYENTDGTFDIHYSHNGAEGYMLKEVLEKYLEGKVEKDAGDMPGLLPKEVEDIMENASTDSDVELEAVEHDLIESDPKAEGVPKEDLPGVVNFFNTEALYVVRDWEVQVYAPIHLSPAVLPHFEHAVELDIYKLDTSEESPGEVLKPGGRQPDYQLSGEDYTDDEVLDGLPEDVYGLLEKYHLDVLDFYNQVYHRPDGRTEHALLADPFVMQYRVKSPAYPLRSMGLFVSVWEGGANEPSYPWAGSGEESVYPRDVANEFRLEVSRNMVERTDEKLAQLGVTLEDEAGQEVLANETERGVTTFLVKLLSEYNTDISREFMPDEMSDRLDEILDALRKKATQQS